MKIHSDFATNVLLNYHYFDKDITLIITDENEIFRLKHILNGHLFTDYPSCGFTTNISITMTNGRKKIIFCPACDGCPLLRINDSNKYIKITDEERTQINEILEKYDITFLGV